MIKTGMVLNLVDGVSNAISGFIGNLLYSLFAIVLKIMDWMQGLFRSLAGLEPIKVDGEIVGGAEGYDLVYYLIGTDIIVDIFISMLVFALFLLIFMTVIALIRNQYQDKQKPPSEIISKSFKGLLGFLLVPIVCVAGLMFSNLMLGFIDGATNASNSTKMSANLFLSSAYDANYLRDDDKDYRKERLQDIVDKTNFENYEGVSDILAKGINQLTDEDYDRLASYADDAFTGGYLVANSYKGRLSYYRSGEVTLVYSTWKINYLILLVGGCVLTGVLIKFMWGLIGRIFKLLLDWVLIPVVLAMMPFDDGNAVKSWKSDFVKNVTMSYAVIGVLNLYYSIFPIVNKIGFTGGDAFFNSFLKFILEVVGIFTANSVINTINGWFGTGNLLQEGENTQKAFKDGWDKIKKKTNAGVKNTVGAFTGFRSGRAAAGKALKGGFGQFMGGVQGALGATGVGQSIDKWSIPKMAMEARKTGKDRYADLAKRGLTKNREEERAARYNLATETSRYLAKYNELENIMLTGSPAEREAAYEEAVQLKSQEASAQQAVKGGAKMTYKTLGGATTTKEISGVTSDYNFQKEQLQKQQEAYTTLNNFDTSWHDIIDNSVEVGLLDSGAGYTYIMHGGSLPSSATEDQKEQLRQLRGQYMSTLRSIKGPAKELIKRGVTLIKPGTTTPYTADTIDSETDFDNILKSLQHADQIQDIYGVGDRKLHTSNQALYAANEQATRELKNMKKQIDIATANLADELHNHSVTESGGTYSVGSASVSDASIDAYNKGAS